MKGMITRNTATLFFSVIFLAAVFAFASGDAMACGEKSGAQKASVETKADATQASADNSGCSKAKTNAIKAGVSGCSKGAKAIKADAAEKTCTKEECVAKLMADGMSREEAEAAYEKCAAKCAKSKNLKAENKKTADKDLVKAASASEPINQ